MTSSRRHPPDEPLSLSAGSTKDVKHLDAVTYLTVFLVLAFAIQSRLVFKPLGGAGSPATVLAIVGLGWWLYFHAQRTWSRWSRQPVRLGVLCLVLALTASYVAAMARPIDSLESSSATLGLVVMLGWAGVALLANDGIPNRERLDVLTGRLVVGATLLGLLGVLQFVTHSGIVTDLIPPGLHANAPVGAVMNRSGFTRPAGTALHPIEFGAVLTATLPIAIVRARHAVVHQARAWACVFIMALGIVVSGSRSGILCTVVGIAVLGVVWSARTRLAALAFGTVVLAFVAFAFPGVSGNLLRLFTGAGDDGSVQSRTGSYAIVWDFLTQAPLFGRGYSTFLPSYRILDNQWLLLVVETGAVGLLAFLGLLAAAYSCARRASRMARDRASIEQGQALAASIAAVAVGFATYDGLSFPMAANVLFLVIGMAGATWRLARLDDEAHVRRPLRSERR